VQGELAVEDVVDDMLEIWCSGIAAAEAARLSEKGCALGWMLLLAVTSVEWPVPRTERHVGRGHYGGMVVEGVPLWAHS
jgi:hypothetical protein